MSMPIYLHLRPGDAPPMLDGTPCKVVVVAELTVSPEWREKISTWLARSRCHYMLAWGLACQDWHESVDYAGLEATNYDVTDETLIMTTAHEGESLGETFWFCEWSAMHPCHELVQTYILHIADEPRADELLQLYRDAEQED